MKARGAVSPDGRMGSKFYNVGLRTSQSHPNLAQLPLDIGAGLGSGLLQGEGSCITVTIDSFNLLRISLFQGSDRRRWPRPSLTPATVPAPQLVSITSRPSHCTLITLDTLLSARSVLLRCRGQWGHNGREFIIALIKERLYKQKKPQLIAGVQWARTHQWLWTFSFLI